MFSSLDRVKGLQKPIPLIQGTLKKIEEADEQETAPNPNIPTEQATAKHLFKIHRQVR